MTGGPMAWWYWFGMWIAAIAGLVIGWWILIDAYRRPGSIMRFLWPLVAFGGCLLQLPAFLVAPASQGETIGTFAGLTGILGCILVGMAVVTYFTGSSSSPNIWSSTTRDGMSASTGSGGLRRGTPHAVVPIAEVSRPSARIPAQVGTPLGAVAESSLRSSPPAVNAGLPAHLTSTLMSTADTSQSPTWDQPTTEASDDETLIGPDTKTRSTSETVHVEHEKTLVEAADKTMVDEPDPTVVDDEDSDTVAAVLSVTDGRTSRIVLTERSGPFRVGRDPSQVNLAVDDSRISRVHFVVHRLDSRFILTDADSANGTFVNGESVVEPRELVDGDTIEFGRTVATFSLPLGAE